MHRTPFSALRSDWRLYAYEAIELAIFMICACAWAVLFLDASAPVLHMCPNPVVRRAIMALAIGATSVIIIRSPFGRRSGAHFNPAITLTYLRLGKIATWDAMFYVLAQFVGAVSGVGIAGLFLHRSLSSPTIDYIVTIPGRFGATAAFAAEFFMGALLMALILIFSNRVPLAGYVPYFVGVLIAVFTFSFASISGVSINPARTIGSAFFAGIWTSVWLYFVAPLSGMLVSAEAYRRINGPDSVLCAKLHPDPTVPCPFNCKFPGHHPAGPEDGYES
nr:aquaporin [Terriglobus sp. TAA 43]